MFRIPRWFSGKESTSNARDAGLIAGLRRSPGEGNGSPLQYSCLGNPMDRGAWWATAHGVTKNQTRQEWLNNNNWMFIVLLCPLIPFAGGGKTDDYKNKRNGCNSSACSQWNEVNSWIIVTKMLSAWVDRFSIYKITLQKRQPKPRLYSSRSFDTESNCLNPSFPLSTQSCKIEYF